MIDEATLVNGLWHVDANVPIIIDGKEVSFVKVYSLDRIQRVAEVSTYPRAYKDTAPHLYTVDTPFMVTESDLNEYLPEGRRYRDRFGTLFSIGQIATHWIGEPLPGSFPLWIESETLSDPIVDNNNDVFYLVSTIFKGQLVNSVVLEAYWRRDVVNTWTPASANIVDQLQLELDTGNSRLRIPKIKKNQHRYILRVLYNRIRQ